MPLRAGSILKCTERCNSSRGIAWRCHTAEYCSQLLAPPPALRVVPGSSATFASAWLCLRLHLDLATSVGDQHMQQMQQRGAAKQRGKSGTGVVSDARPAPLRSGHPAFHARPSPYSCMILVHTLKRIDECRHRPRPKQEAGLRLRGCPAAAQRAVCPQLRPPAVRLQRPAPATKAFSGLFQPPIVASGRSQG